jgi:MtfA peptidase
VTGIELGYVALAILVAGFAWFAVARWRRAVRERVVSEQPFKDEWRDVLRARVPLYSKMPAELRERVERLTLAFIARVDFVGCEGLIVTPEMRLTVSAYAALLVTARGIELYSPLRAVLLYPASYVAPRVEEDEAGVVTEGEDVLSGEAIHTDRIVLSWRDVVTPPDGDGAWNLVLHEFAHFLDASVGGSLSNRPDERATSPWHDVLDAEFERLRRAVDAGGANDWLFDPYGAEDPSEFFAVATETFFELPTQLETQHPQLYRLLADFFALDPARWREPWDAQQQHDAHREQQ